jgi:hypothetical protein
MRRSGRRTEETKEDGLARRIVAHDDFETALVSFGSPEAEHLARALAAYIAEDPGRHTSAFSGLAVRVLRSRAWGTYPALRIFYTYDEEAVHLLHIEVYDELAP